MINIAEHHSSTLEEKHAVLLKKTRYKRLFNRGRQDQLCFLINGSENNYEVKSSYMIGVDWVIPQVLPIYVQPKLNSEKREVDYIKMLFDALQESENMNHLNHLYAIDFKAPLIEIEQQQDKLTPLLVIEFLQLVKQIVRKGLKKSYYKVTYNLNSRIKGKLLVSKTIKKNHSKQDFINNFCEYEEFGYNSTENKILKNALLFTQSILGDLKGISSVEINNVFNYVFPTFQNIDEQIDIKTLKNYKTNTLFKEYTQALKIARLIIKKYGYNISNTSGVKVKTPPFWIDMTKLFELYLYKKLKEVFSERGEVIYHKKYHWLEPDFLLKSNDGRFKVIIDAKYKPQYEQRDISHEDAAQVSGYSRLNSIRNEFKLDDVNRNNVIDTLIVYTSNNALNKDILTEKLLNNKDGRYFKLYKYSIAIPKIDKI